MFKPPVKTGYPAYEDKTLERQNLEFPEEIFFPFLFSFFINHQNVCKETSIGKWCFSAV